MVPPPGHVSVAGLPGRAYDAGRGQADVEGEGTEGESQYYTYAAWVRQQQDAFFRLQFDPQVRWD